MGVSDDETPRVSKAPPPVVVREKIPKLPPAFGSEITRFKPLVGSVTELSKHSGCLDIERCPACFVGPGSYPRMRLLGSTPEPHKAQGRESSFPLAPRWDKLFDGQRWTDVLRKGRRPDLAGFQTKDWANWNQVNNCACVGLQSEVIRDDVQVKVETAVNPRLAPAMYPGADKSQWTAPDGTRKPPQKAVTIGQSSRYDRNSAFYHSPDQKQRSQQDTLDPWVTQDIKAWNNHCLFDVSLNSKAPRLFQSQDLPIDSSLASPQFPRKTLTPADEPRPYLKRFSKTVTLKRVSRPDPEDLEPWRHSLTPIVGGTGQRENHGEFAEESGSTGGTLQVQDIAKALGLQYKTEYRVRKDGTQLDKEFHMLPNTAKSHFVRKRAHRQRHREFELGRSEKRPVGLGSHLFGRTSAGSIEPRPSYNYCTRAYGTCNCPACNSKRPAPSQLDTAEKLQLFCRKPPSADDTARDVIVDGQLFRKFGSAAKKSEDPTQRRLSQSYKEHSDRIRKASWVPPPLEASVAPELRRKESWPQGDIRSAVGESAAMVYSDALCFEESLPLHLAEALEQHEDVLQTLPEMMHSETKTSQPEMSEGYGKRTGKIKLK